MSGGKATKRQVMKRLGAPFLTCPQCGETFFVGSELHTVHVHVDGRLAEATNEPLCSAQCAGASAESFNNGPRARFAGADLHAVPWSSAGPEAKAVIDQLIEEAKWEAAKEQ